MSTMTKSQTVGCYQFYEVFIFSGIHNKILLKDIIIVP